MTQKPQTPLTVHRGLDYACILGPDDTTDDPLVSIAHPTDDELVLLTQMAAAPDLAEALEMLLKNHRLIMMVHGGYSAEAADAMLVAIDGRAALAKAKGAA